MAKGDWAYRADGSRIFIPDVKITKPSPLYTVEHIRGYAFTVAVFNSEGKCIGWAEVD